MSKTPTAGDWVPGGGMSGGHLFQPGDNTFSSFCFLLFFLFFFFSFFKPGCSLFKIIPIFRCSLLLPVGQLTFLLFLFFSHSFQHSSTCRCCCWPGGSGIHFKDLPQRFLLFSRKGLEWIAAERTNLSAIDSNWINSPHRETTTQCINTYLW